MSSKQTDPMTMTYLTGCGLLGGIGTLIVIGGSAGALWGMGMMIAGVVGFGIALAAVQLGRIADALDARQPAAAPEPQPAPPPAIPKFPAAPKPATRPPSPNCLPPAQ